MPQHLLSLAWQVLCLSFDVILVELRVRLQLEAFNEPFHLNKLRVNRAVKNTPPHWVSSYKRHEEKRGAGEGAGEVGGEVGGNCLRKYMHKYTLTAKCKSVE